ncbi:glycine cleavage system protein GcvH [Desulfosarcina sp. OttesenSCG-928-A07]|nr:glycine cleavage system protein GcvH [Desulfosarcina sp. OttesenSCG-928-G17]MDL2329628.1 glycine cleavage system protein GcvH [Desulfosarcina sp. OttesenSCG-928-A07]
MKAIQDLNFPEGLTYSDEHVWVKSQGNIYRIGISDYAQDQLGDVIFVELPEAGSRFSAGDIFGTVESVKTVSDLFMPVDGEVTAVNPLLVNHPEAVNTDPYGKGWMLEIRPDDPLSAQTLGTSTAYVARLGKESP